MLERGFLDDIVYARGEDQPKVLDSKKYESPGNDDKRSGHIHRGSQKAKQSHLGLGKSEIDC